MTVARSWTGPPERGSVPVLALMPASLISALVGPEDLEAVVGDYLPDGLHTTKEEFEAEGCP